MGDFLAVELGQLLVGRFLGLLNQIRVSGRAAPSVRFGEGGAVRPAGSGIEVVPIHLAGTCADPRFGVDAETFAPETVLLRRVAGFAPFFGQFFADGADVVVVAHVDAAVLACRPVFTVMPASTSAPLSFEIRYLFREEARLLFKSNGKKYLVQFVAALDHG